MTLLDKFAPLAELRGALAASGKVPSVATPMDAIHSATEGVIDGRTVLLAGFAFPAPHEYDELAARAPDAERYAGIW